MAFDTVCISELRCQHAMFREHELRRVNGIQLVLEAHESWSETPR